MTTASRVRGVDIKIHNRLSDQQLRFGGGVQQRDGLVPDVPIIPLNLTSLDLRIMSADTSSNPIGREGFAPN